MQDVVEMIKEAVRVAEAATDDLTQVVIMATPLGMRTRGRRHTSSGAIAKELVVSYAELRVTDVNVLKLSVEQVIKSLNAAQQ